MPLMTSLKGMMRDRGMGERRKRTGLKSAGWPGSGLNDIVELIYSPFWSLSQHMSFSRHVAVLMSRAFSFFPPFLPRSCGRMSPGLMPVVGPRFLCGGGRIPGEEFAEKGRGEGDFTRSKKREIRKRREWGKERDRECRTHSKRVSQKHLCHGNESLSFLFFCPLPEAACS